MSKQFDIAIIGGDMRQVYLASLLQKQNLSVICYAIKNKSLSETDTIASDMKTAVLNSSTIIAPIPFSRNQKTIFSNETVSDLDILSFLTLLSPKQQLLSGSISPFVTSYCKEKDIFIFDAMEDETIAISNAIATAEGTILEAIRHSPINLHQSKLVVLGFGKCAKVLANKLKGLDAKVFICARNQKDLYVAKSFGFYTLSFQELPNSIQNFDFIFNTVPSCILTKELLQKIDSTTTIIDIASAPGGVDYEFVKQQNLNAHLCLGLPGKYAAKSSAEILLNAYLPFIFQKNSKRGDFI